MTTIRASCAVLAVFGLCCATKTTPPDVITAEPAVGATTADLRLEDLRADAKKCNCSVVPWSPDPPCVKTCSGLLIAGVSEQELTSTFRLSSATGASLKSIKAGGVTSAELDKFLLSPGGKEFVAGAEKTDFVHMKALVSVAAQPK